MTRIIGKRLKVAHVTPHVGGGVGACVEEFIRNTRLDRDLDQELICLDWCRDNASKLLRLLPLAEGVGLGAPEDLRERILTFDLIVLHYWNHPLLARAIQDGVFNRSRVLIWCHNSGVQEPHILPRHLNAISQCIVFSSRTSEHAPNYKELIGDAPIDSRCVLPIPSLEKFRSIGITKEQPKAIRRLLYVGTVSTAKMHRESPRIFSRLSRSGFQIQVVGGPDHLSLSNAVHSFGGNVKIFGQIEDPVPHFTNADLFVYPLRRAHYGTGEIALMEAVVSGLPVVAFNNFPETYSLAGLTGCRLVSGIDDFVKAVQDFAVSFPAGTNVPAQLSSEAIERFDSKTTARKLKELIMGVAELPIPSVIDTPASPIDTVSLYARHSFFDTCIFDQCLAERERSPLLVLEKIRQIADSPDGFTDWTLPSKSTPAHYLRYFPDDKGLHLVVKMLNESLAARTFEFSL